MAEDIQVRTLRDTSRGRSAAAAAGSPCAKCRAAPAAALAAREERGGQQPRGKGCVAAQRGNARRGDNMCSLDREYPARPGKYSTRDARVGAVPATGKRRAPALDVATGRERCLSAAPLKPAPPQTASIA